MLPCSGRESRISCRLAEKKGKRGENFMIFGKKQQETRERTMIEARAKINLTLDVTGKREDGYL